jgi:hypothetical protein
MNISKREKSACFYHIFVNNGPKPIQAGNQEAMFTHSISAKPQQHQKNCQISPLLINFGKNNY